jgi:hypothetical protein
MRARRAAALRAGLSALAAALLAGCEGPPERPAPPPAVSPLAEPLAEPLAPAAESLASAAPAVRFLAHPLTAAGDLFDLVDRFGGEGLDAILRLNRIDAEHAWRGDTLTVPDPMRPIVAFSPFPARVRALGSVPKALLVALRVQAWAAYAHGRQVRWGPASTGRAETPTCPGLYYTNWKAAERRSTDNPDWVLRWYINFESRGGCSFHVFDLPGRPASHSCVRLLEPDAEWIYHWADQWLLTADEATVLRNGTPVVIFGAYDVEAPPPWKLLVHDPAATDVPPAEVEAAVASHAGSDSLASRTRQGWRIAARLDSLDGRLGRGPLRRALAARGVVLDRIDLLARRAVAWAPADRRVDFDSLRAAFAANGVAVRDFLVDGFGRALRLEGIASFVSPHNERLLYLESLHVPGMNADSAVWARFEGLVSARGEIGDPSAPFRILLSRVRVAAQTE